MKISARDILQLVFNDVSSLDSPHPLGYGVTELDYPACFCFTGLPVFSVTIKIVKSSVMSGSSKSLVLSAAAFERQRLYCVLAQSGFSSEGYSALERWKGGCTSHPKRLEEAKTLVQG